MSEKSRGFTPFLGTCQATGKRQFLTKAIAKDARRGTRGRPSPYLCPHCHYWHLGRSHGVLSRAAHRGEEAGVHIRDVRRRLNMSTEDLTWLTDAGYLVMFQDHLGRIFMDPVDLERAERHRQVLQDALDARPEPAETASPQAPSPTS